jgi:thiol-disulfide isomerase/thioredoxin
MKRLILIFSLFFLTATSQNTKLKLKGSILNNTATELLIKSSDDKVKAILPIKNGKVNSFVEQPIGLYKMMIGAEYTDIYIDNGNLNFTIDLNKFDESILYKGSLEKENNYLAGKLLTLEKFNEAKMYFDKEVNVFLDTLNKVYSYFDSVLSNPELKAEFARKQLNQNKIERYNNMMMYTNYHPYLTKKENFKLPDSYYDFLNQLNLNDRELSSNRDYVFLVNEYINYLQKKQNSADTNIDEEKAVFSKLELLRKKVQISDIRDAIIKMDYPSSMKESKRVNELSSAYIQTAISEKLKKEIEDYAIRLELFKVGNPAPQFTLINDKGQKKSLVDYKGKYVYLDVWATWCGPCKKELPYYEEVKKLYKDSNIEFVSICVWDKKDDWEKFLKEKNLGGEQLFSPKEDKVFVENYLIQGVPTFVLIDKEGKLVTPDAERPSDEALKTRLEALLTK